MVSTNSVKLCYSQEGDSDWPGACYLRLSLRNELAKLHLHQRPLLGIWAAGQERCFLQQVLRPLCCLRAHPSLHDNTKLAQSASQQGLQKKQRGCLGSILRWMICRRPSCSLSCRPTENGWGVHLQAQTQEDLEASHTGEIR